MAAFHVFLRILFISKIFFMNFSSSELIDTKLVFELQDFFQSDLTLVAKDFSTNADNLIKKFCKHENIKQRRFFGAINIKEDFAEVGKNLFSPYQNVMVILDAKTNSIEALIQVQNLHLMSSFIWIYFFQDGSTEKLNDLYIPFNSQFYLIKKIDDFTYEIEDVYQVSENSGKIYTRFGLWENGRLKIFENDSYGRRMDLKGHHFNIAEAYFEENKDLVESYWTLFSGKMNFSVTWHKRRFGELFTNGTAVGVFKDVIEREIDGTPGHNLYIQERINAFDYIFPAFLSETKFFLKLDSEFDWESYLEPFHMHVYLSIFIWMIISSIIIQLVVKLKGHTTSETPIFIVLRALFSQGGTPVSSTPSLYISYIMPYLLTVILTQYYSGALSSILAVKETNVPFKNVEDIVNDGSYKINLYRRSYPYQYFVTDPGPIAAAAREKKLLVRDDQMPLSIEAGVDSICVNRWVFLNYVTSYAINEKCEIAEVEQPFFVYTAGIIVWKGFPYKNVMTKIMKRLQFAGLIRLRWKSYRTKNKGEPFEPFSMELVYPIFMLYVAIIILSAVILYFELWWKKRAKLESPEKCK